GKPNTDPGTERAAAPTPAAPSVAAAAQHAPASTKLVSGPTTAIKNSSAALAGSSLIVATPPKMKSVTRCTSAPRARATREWASSCSNTQTKSASAETAPASQYVNALQPGCVCGK